MLPAKQYEATVAYLSANHAALTPEMLNRLHAAAELEHRQNGECHTARPTPTLADSLTPWCDWWGFLRGHAGKADGNSSAVRAVHPAAACEEWQVLDCTT